ncbi:MAG TPA: molybdenum cofactor guanylyltransferase [Verrucomicrobiae bacterium]|nr:molybdenum cofactor guanylyltransferase [Verrucomicrobiae bacterium]
MTFTAMLMAGGLSRRMGSDKASLEVGGEALWARQVRVLRELTPAAVWVSARATPAWCPRDLEVVLDERPSRGPLSGLTAALTRLRTTHLLVLAIDLPGISSGHLRKLQQLASPGRGVLPLNQDYYEPLCAVYPTEAVSAAQTALRHGELSLQNLAQALVRDSLALAYKLEPPEREYYQNLNHRSDARRFEEALGMRERPV